MILTFTMSQKVLKSLLKSEYCAKICKRWLNANRLSLNVDKTNCIIFHSPRTKLPPGNAIKTGNKHISKVTYVKGLGLLMDEHFSWNYHPCQLSKKLSRICGILGKTRRYLTTDMMKFIYNSLLISFLKYGITVWGQTYEAHREPIFKLRKAIRIISNQTSHSNSSPLFKDLQLLRSSDIIRHLHLNLCI